MRSGHMVSLHYRRKVTSPAGWPADCSCAGCFSPPAKKDNCSVFRTGLSVLFYEVMIQDSYEYPKVIIESIGNNGNICK